MRASFLSVLLGAMLFWACSSNKQTTASQNTVLSLPQIEKQTLSSNDQARFDATFAEAMLQKETSEYDAAYELLQHCYTIDSTNAQLLYELSTFYQARGTALYNTQKAADYLERAVALEPTNYWYNQALSDMYITLDTVPLAIAVQENLYKRYPEKEEIYSRLVTLYQYTGQYPKAIEMLNAMEEREGKSMEISMEKFRMYVQMKQMDNAYAEINALIKEYPEEDRYQVILGNLYESNNEQEKALQLYNEILEKDSNNLSARLSLLDYYTDHNEDSLAYITSMQLLKNPQLQFKIRCNIMRDYAIKHDSDSVQVIRTFREVLQALPEEADTHLFVASYMEVKNQPADSIETIYRHILSVEPDNALARLYLLRSTLKRNDYEGAIQICLPALDYNREEIEFYFYLANAYYILNREQEAFDICGKGLEYITENTLSSLSSDMYALYGDISYSMNKKELCFNSYEKSIAYNPDNIGCLNNYAYYLSEENRDLDKAEEMSFRVIKAEPNNTTYLDTYAWILFMKGEYDDAKRYIDKAIGADKETDSIAVNPEIFSHAGDIYYKCGEPDTAVHYWSLAESIESTALLRKKIRTRKYWKK